MPIPLIIPAAIAAGGAVAKWLRGNSQQSKADEILRNNKRPTKTVQQEYYDNVALASNKAANNKLPGQNVMETKLSSGVSSGISNLVNTQRDPAAIAAGVAALDQNYNKSIEDLGVKGAQYQEGWQKTLMNTRVGLAGQKDAAWDWNSKQKYLSAMAAASSLQNAANNNKDNAIQDVAQMGTALAFSGTAAGGAAAGTGTAGKSFPINSGGLGTNTGFTGNSASSQKIMSWRKLNNDYVTPDVDIMGKIGF